MEEALFNLPDELFTPEELERYNKFKADVTAFYKEHGDHLDWLNQAVDLGLMEVTELTPDDMSYMEEVARIAEENNMTEFEGYEEMMAARYRTKMLQHFQEESKWIMRVAGRKKVEVGKRLIGNYTLILENMQKYIEQDPDNEEISDAIGVLVKLIEKMKHDITLEELQLDAYEQSTAN